MEAPVTEGSLRLIYNYIWKTTRSKSMTLEDKHQCGSFDERLHVSPPEQFPPPKILKRAHTSGTVVDTCGNPITDGKILYVEEGPIFFIEHRVLKDTVYGSVHWGSKLKKIDCNTFLLPDDMSQEVAVKTYSKATMEKTVSHEDPLSEFAAMQFIGNNHPNISSQICCIEDDDTYFSIMRFHRGCELFDCVVNKSLSEASAKRIFLKLLDVFQYLQSRNVAHMDLSCENIIVLNPENEKKVDVVLIDFGMSLRVPQSSDNKTPSCCLIPPQGSYGKKNYIAPEVLQNGSPATARPFNPLLCDMWALGVILFMMLTGEAPFGAATPAFAYYADIMEGKLSSVLSFRGLEVSPLAQDLIQSILCEVPSKRPSILTIRSHQWFKDCNF